MGRGGREGLSTTCGGGRPSASPFSPSAPSVLNRSRLMRACSSRHHLKAAARALLKRRVLPLAQQRECLGRLHARRLARRTQRAQ
eukprot:5723232-Prymnesium_polylepis.1